MFDSVLDISERTESNIWLQQMKYAKQVCCTEKVSNYDGKVLLSECRIVTWYDFDYFV